MTVQMELMRPKALNEARDRFPVAYIPIGAIEFHGRHLPIGLDTLKCHRLLCRIAAEIGGLVAPPLFYGFGGGHLDFDWTWMLDEETLKKILLTTLHGLARNGFLVIVVMSGHYPNDQLYPALKERYHAQGGGATLLTMMEYDPFRAAGEEHGDHAAKWETSYMLALGEDLVDLEQLRKNPAGVPVEDFAPPRPGAIGSWWFEKDPAHPWFGIAAAAGNSPLEASKEAGEMAIQRVTAWVGEAVREALTEAGWTASEP